MDKTLKFLEHWNIVGTQILRLHSYHFSESAWENVQDKVNEKRKLQVSIGSIIPQR